MRYSWLTTLVVGAALTACAQPTSFDPQDPAVTAQIDSIVQSSLQGARTVNADQVLAMAGGDSTLTFITGDLLLSGLPTIQAAFQDTYAGLESQDIKVLDQHVRLVSPNVALLTAIAEGTYTDVAGWTSDPVGMGYTIVFVRDGGKWHAVHAHQSIAF